MKEVTLKIPDKKFRFFMELIKNLGFVKVKDEQDPKEGPYDPEFVRKVLQGDKDIADGKGIKMTQEEFRALCK